MIDPTADLAAILNDCGGTLTTSRGDLVGRFVEEPDEFETPGGQIVARQQAVIYSDRKAIESIRLTAGDWIETQSGRFKVRLIPQAETSGLVRIELGQ